VIDILERFGFMSAKFDKMLNKLRERRYVIQKFGITSAGTARILRSPFRVPVLFLTVASTQRIKFGENINKPVIDS